MNQELVINILPSEKRAALLEDRRLVELFIERPFSGRVAGNIYKGRVENVLPGMQAAFVNIGLDRNAFLYVDDALAYFSEDEEAPVETEVIEEPRRRRRPTIAEILHEGQEIVVQVVKEPMGTKGARVVTRLTLPGRYVVLMPGENYIGISRRIENQAERDRLRQVAERLRPQGMGLIIRTAAESCQEEELRRDVRFLVKLWEKIMAKAQKTKAPALLYRDYDLTYRLVRDIYTDQVEKITVDNRQEYEKIKELLGAINPKLRKKVSLYQSPQPIFDYYGLETQIERALKRKVWLESGGYLVIDETEALVSIDVNTGKFIGTDNLADTVLQTNLEAAVEIARQLRLRNIGGIIIVDFIDMETDADRQKVLKVLEEEIKKDRIKTNIVGFTALGLVEITRKKVKRDLEEVLQKRCPYCDGTGRVFSEETVAIMVERRLKAMDNDLAEAVLVTVHPSVAAMLIGSGGSNLHRLEEELGKDLFIRGCEHLHLHEVNMVAGKRAEIEKMALPVHEGQRLQLKIEEPHMTNPRDGIARVEGYVINIEGAGAMIGQEVDVEITRAFRTYARGRVIYPALEETRVEASGQLD